MKRQRRVLSRSSGSMRSSSIWTASLQTLPGPTHAAGNEFLTTFSTPVRSGAADPSGHDTVCALGNLKDREFEWAVKEEGVKPFESTVALIRSLRSRGTRTALISSSRHARMLLATAGITDLFDAIIDGSDAEALGLPGKPEPAIFLAAARQLAVEPSRAAVVEDALAGVQAGHRGGFCLVIGVDRSSQADALREQGADVVVSDLADLELRIGASEGSP